MSALTDIRDRITRLTLAAGLPRQVWGELCKIDSDLRAALRAQTADADRVRAAVREAALHSANPTLVDHETANAIADRIAAQIPAPPTEAARLRSDRDDPKRVQDVVREILVAFIASDGPVTTAEEIDVIADRVAAGLTARAVDRDVDDNDDPDHFIT